MPLATRFLLRSRWPWWAASLALTLGLFVSTVLGWLWYVDQRDARERRLALDLMWLEQTMQHRLQTHQRMLVNWSHDLVAPSAADLGEFDKRIAGLIKDQPALLAIDHVDENGRRLAGLPQYTERPSALAPLSDPLIAGAVARSRALGRPSYSQVIEQGAPLWVLAVPVMDEAGHHGSVLATYDLDRLLEQEVPWWFVQRYDLSLVDRENKRLSHRDEVASPSVEGEDVHRLAFGTPDSGLSLLASAHAPGRPPALMAWLAVALVALALLIMWLLSVLQRWLRERLAAQQALSDSREQLHAVLAGLGAAVSVSARADGRLLFRNRHHENVFEMQPEGPCCLVQGLQPALDDQARSVEALDPASGRWWRRERRTMQWVDGSIALLDIATDVTAEREAARTARERDELLQHNARLASLAELASGIAHELNQPLEAIANYAAVAGCWLDNEPLQRQRVEDAVSRVGEEAHRAGRIIASLRCFIQKRSVEHRPMHMLDLLREPLALLEPMAQRLQIGIAVRARGDTARVECDGVMIEQVLVNLLRNALESVASRGGPPPPDAVTVTIEEADDGVTVVVADRGTGIADPERLFNAFYTTKAEGMGLGLAICRTVIESHGGRLWAESAAGGGARMCFRLPRAVALAA